MLMRIRDPEIFLILDPGSRMGKNSDPESEINIPDPQQWLQVTLFNHNKILLIQLCYCLLVFCIVYWNSTGIGANLELHLVEVYFSFWRKFVIALQNRLVSPDFDVDFFMVSLKE